MYTCISCVYPCEFTSPGLILAKGLGWQRCEVPASFMTTSGWIVQKSFINIPEEWAQLFLNIKDTSAQPWDNSVGNRVSQVLQLMKLPVKLQQQDITCWKHKGANPAFSAQNHLDFYFQLGDGLHVRQVYISTALTTWGWRNARCFTKSKVLYETELLRISPPLDGSSFSQ